MSERGAHYVDVVLIPNEKDYTAETLLSTYKSTYYIVGGVFNCTAPLSFASCNEKHG